MLGESAGGQLAPMAGFTGEGDTAIQAVILWYGTAEAVTLIEALRAQGVRCDLLPVEGADHLFTGAAVEVGTLTEASTDFLDDILTYGPKR